MDRLEGRAFLAGAVDGRFEVPDPGVLIGFHVPSAGGANGFGACRADLAMFLRTDSSTNEPGLIALTIES